MTQDVKWHRHFGVYGICQRDTASQILLVKKARGPYSGRYDLPGGSIQSKESLRDALCREFLEETNLQVVHATNLGAYDFLVKVLHKDTNYTHHVALLYQVHVSNLSESSFIEKHIETEAGWEQNDSEGYEWVDILSLNELECSPLVWKVRRWVETGEFTNEMLTYEDWEVLA